MLLIYLYKLIKRKLFKRVISKKKKKENSNQISKMDELLEYQLLNDQFTYMTNKMPKVIEKIKSGNK